MRNEQIYSVSILCLCTIARQCSSCISLFSNEAFFLASLTFRFYSIEVQLDLKRCVFNNAIFFSVNIVGISAKSSILRYRSCSKP